MSHQPTALSSASTGSSSDRTRYQARDIGAIAAAVAAPLGAAAVLLPFRSDWSNTNVALLLVVVVVARAGFGAPWDWAR